MVRSRVPNNANAQNTVSENRLLQQNRVSYTIPAFCHSILADRIA